MDKDNIKIKENKKEDKRAFLPFLVVMVVCIFVGFIVGTLVSFFSDKGINAFYSNFYNYTGYIVPPVLFLMTMVCALASVLFYIKGKKMYKKWNGDDEDYIMKIEKILSIGSILLSFSLVLSFINYTVTFSYIKAMNNILLQFVVIGGYLLVMLVFYIIMQQQYVNLAKIINPEKRGSAFDFKFNKKWTDSCDEAEKQALYRASHKTYNITQIVCLALCIILFLTDQTFNTGVLPIIVVSIIWLVLVSSYSYFLFRESYRKEK